MTTVGEFLVANVVGESIKVVDDVWGHRVVGADAFEAQVRLGALMLAGSNRGCLELESWVRGKRVKR